MWIRRLTGLAVVLLIFGMVVVLPAGLAGAAPKNECKMNVTVTDGGDSGNITTTGQLRTAIYQVCPGGHVEVASSVSNIQLLYPISLTQAVTVSGNGQTIQRGYDAVFIVSTNGELILTGFTLSGNSSYYRAIEVEGALKLSYVTVTGFENAIYAKPGSSVKLKKDTVITGNSNGWGAEGGSGIYNDGGNVELFDNAAVTDNVGRACFSPGHPAPASFGWGGGIFGKNGGSITLHDYAVVSGNGFLYCDETKEGWTGYGGGIGSMGGTVTLTGSAEVTGNWAQRGGGIELYQGASLTLSENAAVTGNHSGGVAGGVAVLFGSQLTLKESSTISGNMAAGNGGGVFNGSGAVTLRDNARITGNSAGNGGGVYNHDYGGSYQAPELVVKDHAAITGNTPNDVSP